MGESDQGRIEDEEFRAEVRRFLHEAYTPDMRRQTGFQAGVIVEPVLGQKWHAALAQRGWAAPNWPAEYGGPGWDVRKRHIFEEECARVDAPSRAVQGLLLVAPAVMKYGSEEQKRRFLPGILSGELYFCQGFSEPGSGSDLASLQTSAVQDGDGYVIDGQKIWTTHAQHANWIFLLVRTSSEGKPQAGITFLLAPMDSPGITVRPIISMSGEHELNEVFFDSVRVPVGNRIGEENEGWAVTKYLLEFERGQTYSPAAQGLLEQVKRIARVQPGDEGDVLWDDAVFRRKAAELEIDILALAASERGVVSSLQAGDNVGAVTAAVLKISGSELYQRATELGVESLGTLAFADQSKSLTLDADPTPIGPDYAAKPVAKYLNARAMSIYAGTTEVLKNIIARDVLSRC